MDYDALLEPLLEGGHQRGRRPRTLIRTGRRGRLNALAADSQTLVGSSSDFSTRHTTLLEDTGGEPLVALNSLLNTLQESGIPGPQLLRLQEEFFEPLGEGGQGNVRGLDFVAAKRYQGVRKSIRTSWPADLIAIKQHLERKETRIFGNRFDKKNLSSRIRAAELEVLALAPAKFHNHPNIVKLVGWGLCLDTLEYPESPCCDGVQLPLLIYERAEMNLSEFLEAIFNVSRERRSDEVFMEEGRGVSSQTHHLLSLTGHVWRSLGSWMRPKPDVYALIRLLCIHVGHGLKSLHDNNFTHGDLKPDNILIFRDGNGWIAKLCDFGCARGRDSDASSTPDDSGSNAKSDPEQKRKRRKATYLGTTGWRPLEREISAIQGFNQLRQCDLYVYGLLVWSSFCRQGGHYQYPGDPNLRYMLDDVEQITVSRFRFFGCKKWIASQVKEVLMDTMKPSELRSLEPWTFFDHRSLWGQEQAETFYQSPEQAADAKLQEAQDDKFQLSMEMKRQYNNLAWWSGHDQPLGQKSGHSGSNDNNKSGPASSAPIDSDDNCLSTKLFHTERRRYDSEDLCFRMVSLLEKLKKMDHPYRVRPYPPCLQEMYHLARFRSRVPIKWWRGNDDDIDDILENGDNILRGILQSAPSADMHTLAWLCAGPIGRREVMSLRGRYSTWASVLEPGALDESEKLDRFLLLLQFGAPVATPLRPPRKLPCPINSPFEQEDLNTVFMHFLQSCRPAIVVAALKQIFGRLKRAEDEGFISDDTSTYFKRIRNNGLLQKVLGSMDPSLAGISPEATETSAMNRLPDGWTAIKDKECCYKEGLTQSVTLVKPRVSLLKRRQLTVGFLLNHGEDGTLCHVDLLACMRVGSSQESDVELAQDLEQRFPYYDEAWYVAEWNKEPVVVDVLKSLKDVWRIRTFNSRLRAPRGNFRGTAESLFVIILLTLAFTLVTTMVIVVAIECYHSLAMRLLVGGLLIVGLGIRGRL
ncbi:hypothetical protein CKAH01_16516 [Colletotrichum kahawae]|uniref:Protein kinase domain-containing protein n=1 Tax=Colletotrichum kahawae TaxID=34407 RepID=A0AAE0D659_COLKA|nr:hypothetical protein CKAH01_16516 [Colletotrichum kahawae]